MTPEAPGKPTGSPAADPHRTSADQEYRARDDLAASINACYEAIRERMADGGKGWGKQ